MFLLDLRTKVYYYTKNVKLYQYLMQYQKMPIKITQLEFFFIINIVQPKLKPRI